MKKIPEPELKDAVILSAAEMNKIHFGGKHSPISPKDMANIASDKELKTFESNDSSNIIDK